MLFCVDGGQLYTKTSLLSSSCSFPAPQHMAFAGRTVAVVNDLTMDEQLYLYESCRKLKHALRHGGDLSEFKIADEDVAVYMIFMEDSTRTKESFRNAAKFHSVKLNDFDCKQASFSKKESLTDTVKMLFGYSCKQTIFILRTKMEVPFTLLDRTL